MTSPRYSIRVYGCQMNVHDAEKLENLLLHAGYVPAGDEAEAELLLVHTCSIREKAEHRLYSDLGALKDWKAQVPGRVLGVGGCVAQQQGDALLRRFRHLDLVFGTHNLRWVPSMIEAARGGSRAARTDEDRSLARFDLPERHPAFRSRTPGRAFVTVMEGCDMYCSFCVVPSTRGREISRPAGEIVAECERLADRGVREVTLLGQTVNAYGRHDLRRGRTAAAGTVAFADLLARLDAIPGIERIRYTSPHPLFFDDELIQAHGMLASLCPHVHLPLQSGSNRVLSEMRRRYTRESFADIASGLRSSRSDLVLTTDLIVAFPGETEADFEDTLELMRRLRFVDAYSFAYSARPGTAAASRSDGLPPEEASRRLTAVQDLQRELTLSYHRERVGGSTQVLLEGASRKSKPGGLRQVFGRDPYHRIVNVELGSGPSSVLEPGTSLRVRIEEATPHSLIGAPAVGCGNLEDLAVDSVKAAAPSADETSQGAVLASGGGGPR